MNMMPPERQPGDSEPERFLERAKVLFGSYEEIKIVYLFGSTARGDRGTLSDYDFAVFLDNIDRCELADVRFRLMDELSRLLGSDRIDLVMLDELESPELKYSVVKEGEVVFEREPYRLLFEPRDLNEYFDFRILLERHGLTKVGVS